MSEKRRIISNTMANGLAQFTAMAASLIFMPILIRSFGPANFGLFILATSVAAYASLVDFGVGTSLRGTRYGGTEKPKMVEDLAHLIATHAGHEGEVVWNASKPNGQPRRKLDVSRAREYIGFEAAVPFEEGIKATVEWWEANREGYDERDWAHRRTPASQHEENTCRDEIPVSRCFCGKADSGYGRHRLQGRLAGQLASGARR